MQRRILAALTAAAETTLRASHVAGHDSANDDSGAAPAAPEQLPVKTVSLARAAKLLGVSKSRTLLPAVEAGVVRTVGQGKRRLVPPDELRRLATDGICAQAKKRRSPRGRPAGSSPAPVDVANEAARVLGLLQW
jgi:hypothetical protein